MTSTGLELPCCDPARRWADRAGGKETTPSSGRGEAGLRNGGLMMERGPQGPRPSLLGLFVPFSRMSLFCASPMPAPRLDQHQFTLGLNAGTTSPRTCYWTPPCPAGCQVPHKCTLLMHLTQPLSPVTSSLRLSLGTGSRQGPFLQSSDLTPSPRAVSGFTVIRPSNSLLSRLHFPLLLLILIT